MLVSYFSPLAPVVVLLLSAFILSIITPRLPVPWRAHGAVRYALAPGLVVLAGLILASTKLSVPQMLSGWNFGTVESGVGLTVRVGPAILPFLLLTVIILLVVMLLSLPFEVSGGRAWVLTLGAGTILLLTSANSLTLVYAVLLVDGLLAYHWFVGQQNNLSIGRLFLGIFTAGALTLNTGLGGGESSAGTILLGSALWLRLGLYPFFEIHAAEKQSQNYNRLAYWSLSLVGGLYLASQILTTPLPEILRWSVVAIMLLHGLLGWLSPTNPEGRTTLLTRLVFTQASLPVLLIVPSPEISTAFALGLTLSLAALWATLQLGPIETSHISKAWPYLAPLAATVTLLALPFLLTWPVWVTFFTGFAADSFISIVVILALALAMSGLTRYWLNVWQGEQNPGQQPYPVPAVAAIVAAIPFLMPGLAPFILATIMQTDLPAMSSGHTTVALVLTVIIAAGAVGLGYYRTQLIAHLNISTTELTKILDLQWLLLWLEKLLTRLSKFILRINVILEGQHYLGWALLTTLVGSLIIILTRGT